jgi:hypothetical protein
MEIGCGICRITELNASRKDDVVIGSYIAVMFFGNAKNRSVVKPTSGSESLPEECDVTSVQERSAQTLAKS